MHLMWFIVDWWVQQFTVCMSWILTTIWEVVNMLREHGIVRSKHVTQFRRQETTICCCIHTGLCNDYICRDKRLAAHLAGLRFTNIYLGTRLPDYVYLRIYCIHYR
jgi:hypothetical protein